MDNHYFRPKSIKEALGLLSEPNSIPLSGGTHLTQEGSQTRDLIDIQDLDLDKIILSDGGIEIGSFSKLQHLLDIDIFPQSFKTAIKLEEPLNLRNSASVGGLLITCNGRSPIITSFLSMNATVQIQPNSESIELKEFLKIRKTKDQNYLITAVKLQKTKDFVFQYISRTLFDKPIICAALSILENGEKCLALGGFGTHPIVVFNDLKEQDLPVAARNAYKLAEDQWATAEYRASMAEILTKRCLNLLS